MKKNSAIHQFRSGAGDKRQAPVRINEWGIQTRMARLLMANLLFIGLLGVGWAEWGVVKKENIYVRTRYLVFLI